MCVYAGCICLWKPEEGVGSIGSLEFKLEIVV